MVFNIFWPFLLGRGPPLRLPKFSPWVVFHLPKIPCSGGSIYFFNELGSFGVGNCSAAALSGRMSTAFSVRTLPHARVASTVMIASVLQYDTKMRGYNQWITLLRIFLWLVK